MRYFQFLLGYTLLILTIHPYHHWNYVGYGNFCDPYVYNYYVAPTYKSRIHSGTKHRHNFVYYNGRIQNRGVDVKYVSDRSGKKIKQRDLVRVSDSRELKRDGSGKRNEIRTLDIKRDELIRNDLGRMEIKRENRKTSIDMEKVKIGRREDVTNIKRDDQVKNRSLDGLKTDQIRKDVKNGVDQQFEKNRNKSTRDSDKNVDRKQTNIESQNRKDVNTRNQVDTQRKTKDLSVRNENQVKQQNRNKTNESTNLNRQKQEQTREVKKDKK